MFIPRFGEFLQNCFFSAYRAMRRLFDSAARRGESNGSAKHRYASATSSAET
jgi:hypothetical protein